MELTFVTGNEGKAREVRDALQRTDVTVQREDIDLIEIDAPDVGDVAEQKARDASRAMDGAGPVMVDDTGLYIPALNGFPGSHAGYVYKRLGCAGILRLMEREEDRSATFRTVIAVHLPDQDRVVRLEGSCTGTITDEERGTAGFGYDPVFVPDGHDRTFAEDMKHKEAVSHRSEAIEKLVAWIGEYREGA